MKISIFKQLAIMAIALMLAVSMMPWSVLAQAAQGDQIQAFEDQTVDQTADQEQLEAQKKKTIGVLLMMVSFFKEEVQDSVRTEIQTKSAEIENLTNILDVVMTSNELLIYLINTYPMKATTLDEWKTVVTDINTKSLDPDYFKDSEKEKVSKIREKLEDVIATAKTEDDISTIKTALVTALGKLMQCNLPEEYQIHAISEVKGMYQGAIEKGADGKSLVPEDLWDDLKEAYNSAVKRIKRSESEENAKAYAQDFWEVVMRMKALDNDVDLETGKKTARRLLRSILNLYASENVTAVTDIIDDYTDKIPAAQTSEEVWQILVEANNALIKSGVTPRFDSLDQWKEWAKTLIAAVDTKDYVVEDRAMVEHILTNAKASIDDALRPAEVQMTIFASIRHLLVARDLQEYRREIIKSVEEATESVCKSMDYISLNDMGDKAAVRVDAERIIRQISNSVSANEMKAIAYSLSGVGLNSIKAWIGQFLKKIQPEKYVEEDRKQLEVLISDIQEKLRTAEKMDEVGEVLNITLSIGDKEYTLLTDAVAEATIAITDHARKAQINLTGDARYEVIQSELEAISRLSKLKSKKDLDTQIQGFDKKVEEIKAAVKATADKAAADKAAADKAAADKAAADKAAAQKNAEKKFVVKGRTLKASAGANKTFGVKKVFSIKNAPSSLTFKKINKAGKSNIVVAKSGKVVVKKGLKKGTYKVKVRVISKATATLKKIAKNTVLKVRVN